MVDAEGVEYEIDWDTFSAGASAFIPTVATDKTIRTIRSSANRNNVQVVCRVGERGGYWGVGIWRVG